jgi:hypothetical protein
LLAAVTKGLDSGQRNADGVGVVAMRRERAAAKMCLQPLDAVASFAH